MKSGDGFFGWPEEAPFDADHRHLRGPGTVRPALFDQLKEGGRLIIPLGGARQFQVLTLVTKRRRTGAQDQGDTRTSVSCP